MHIRLKKLTTLDYFSRKQIAVIDSYLIKMLKEMAFKVFKRRCKNRIGQMFSIESVLVKKLLNWFNQKFKRQFEKTDPFQKIR